MNTELNTEQGTDCNGCSNVIYDEHELCNECRSVSNEAAHESFRELLDDGEPVRIGSLTYSPYRVLKSVDPIAWDEAFNDYRESLARDGFIVENYNDN